MTRLFHFAQGLPEQTESLAYGAKTATEFRVTSSFQMTGNETAYAMLSGTILLQQQTDNPDKVNLILKPIPSSNIKMPVKYVVYRGLDICSFLTENDMNDPNTTVLEVGSELIVEMRRIQQGRTGDEIPLEALFGYREATDDTDIDTFFRRQQDDVNYQLFSVPGGMKLGCFAAGEEGTIGEGGIEIILENPDLQFTVEIAKKAVYEIKVDTLPPPPAQETPENRWKREQIRHFVDPAAFYGLHHDIRGGIGYRKTEEEPPNGWPRTSSAEEVYKEIINKFATKNNIYLDIRNKNGYSFDYYAQDNKDIRINNGFINNDVDAGPVVEPVSYRSWNNWPVFLLNEEILDNTTIEFQLQLARGTDLDPIIIGQYNNRVRVQNINLCSIFGAIERNNRVFKDNLGEVTHISSGKKYTRSLQVRVPLHTINGTNRRIASIIRLDYISKPSETDTSFFPQKRDTDFILPAKVKIPWQGYAPLKWNSSYIDRCFYRYNGDTVTALQSGVAEEELRGTKCLTYYAVPVAYFRNPRIVRTAHAFNANGGTAASSAIISDAKFNFLTYFDRKSTAGIQKDPINGINIFSYVQNDIIKGGDAFLLGITEEEKKCLLLSDIADEDSKIFSDYHHVFFKMEKLNPDNDDDYRYKLFAFGVNAANEPIPSNDYVIVFSKDRKIFVSKEYQRVVEFDELPGNRPVVHFRRPDRQLYDFGFDWLREGNRDIGNSSNERSYIGGSGGLCIRANSVERGHIRDSNLAQRYLKNEYKPELIDGLPYYVPWLCVRPNRPVTLNLHIANNNTGNNDNKIRFMPSAGIKLTLSNPDADNPYHTTVGNLKNAVITIECETASYSDRMIEVLDDKDRLIGKVNVFRNAHQLNLPVPFVRLTLQGRARIRRRNHNFNDINDNDFQNAWRDYLGRDKNNNHTKNCLSQSLVNYEPDYSVDSTGRAILPYELRINVETYQVDLFENNVPQLPINHATDEIREEVQAEIKKTIQGFIGSIDDIVEERDENGVSLNETSIIFRDGELVRSFNNLIESISKQYALLAELSGNKAIAFLPDCRWRRNRLSVAKAFAITQKSIIFSISRNERTTELSEILKRIDCEFILVHEIGHCLRLEHSFPDGNPRQDESENKKFIFRQFLTENIMDYPSLETEIRIRTARKLSFWKWQWEMMLNN